MKKLSGQGKMAKMKLKLLEINCNKKNFCVFFPKEKIDPQHGAKI